MYFKHSTKTVALGMALATLSGSIAASGFALIEQNGSGLGNAYAGGAAGAEDASTIFYNPAGMTRLSGKQIVLSGSFIKPTIEFTGTGLPGTNMGGDAGNLTVAPNAYLAMEVTSAIHVGVGVNTPFGLQTEYDPLWVGRAHAIKSQIDTFNVNPSVAYQINDSISIGAGINYQHISSELTDYAGGGGTRSVKGNDSAWGYNMGVLYNFTPQTRAGISYRSAIDYTMQGDVTFSAAPASNGAITLAIQMPDSLSTSLFHNIGDEWDLMADVSWTGWSKFKQLNVTRASGVSLMSVTENWKDTWRASIGANHHYNSKWTSRAGLAYDQSPVPGPLRTARIPDSDRTWLSIGGQYKPFNESAIDFGYAHLFIKNSLISSTVSAPTLSGGYKSYEDIVSIQYTQSF